MKSPWSGQEVDRSKADRWRSSQTDNSHTGRALFYSRIQTRVAGARFGRGTNNLYRQVLRRHRAHNRAVQLGVARAEESRRPMSGHGRALLRVWVVTPQRPLVSVRPWVGLSRSAISTLESAILTTTECTVAPSMIVCPSQETALPGLPSSVISRTSGGYSD